MYDIQRVINILKERTAKPCIKLNTILTECTQFDSKVGGTPYVPNEFEYPRSTINNEPLQLLAQINFEQMPKLEDFPSKGILQFYIQDTFDTMYGLDFSTPTQQKDFRVIYHENIDYSANNLDKIPTIKQCSEFDFIVEKCCKLVPQLINNQAMLMCDVNFWDTLENIFIEIYPNATKQEFEDFCQQDDTDNYIWDNCFNEDLAYHSIGGYPFFTQSDPREECSYADYTTLLLQLNTDDTCGMTWGDNGIGNFFIKPNDLKNLNFNDVLYYWDCY